jgi:hypothetical protein
MVDRARAMQALDRHADNRRERNPKITQAHIDRAAAFLAELLPVAERHGITDTGVDLHLARAALDAVLAPPPRPPKARRRQWRGGGVGVHSQHPS